MLYTGTEYDAFAVGEWRVVQSYCPRRHCYVTDVAAPIVAARARDNDPEAAMQPEKMPGRKEGEVIDMAAARAVADALRQRIARLLQRGPLNTLEIAAALDEDRMQIQNVMRKGRGGFVIIGKQKHYRTSLAIWALRED